jgi:Bifunctional DNA primase/polymerase, N-terminal/YspA, cpYpsA-related SLOG family
MSADPRGPDIPQTILVTGGRAWSDFGRLTKALDEATRQARRPVRLLVGDCPTGADQQARIWARRRRVPAEVFRARWDDMATEGKPRKAAGPLRNLELLDALDQAAGERLVYAFHDDLEHSRGTRHCVAAARRRGYDVILVGREPWVEILEREGIAKPGSLRAAALDYARRGISVVPLHYPVEHLRPHEPPAAGCSCRAPDCQRIGKHPMAALVPHGVKDASSDLAVVAAWWTRHPQANIGLATGFKFDVLDVDGPDGAAWLRWYAGEHYIRVDGPLVRTGSGGWHYYLAPTGLRCPPLWDHDTSKELGRLDWRGEGGLVVAPPSVHATGRAYRFVRDLDTVLSEAPPALRALLDPPAGRSERPSIGGARLAALDHPYAVAALDGECRRVATTPPGSHQRNKTLYKASLRLHSYVAGGLLDAAEVDRRLLEAARACGLAERRAIQSIQNAARVARDHPKGVPDRPGPPCRSRRPDRDEQEARGRWGPQEREHDPER